MKETFRDIKKSRIKPNIKVMSKDALSKIENLKFNVNNSK